MEINCFVHCCSTAIYFSIHDRLRVKQARSDKKRGTSVCQRSNKGRENKKGESEMDVIVLHRLAS